MPPVIDFHVHPIIPGTANPWLVEWMRASYGPGLEEHMARFSQPESLVDLLRSLGVDYAVILAEECPAVTGRITSQEVAEFCAGRPNLIPFASLNPNTVAQPGRELRRLVAEHGFRGLKLYPTYQFFYPNDPALYPLYAAAEELGVLVMFHTGSSVFRGSRIKYGDPVFFDDVAVDFPDLRVIMAHSGRGFWYDRAFFLARLHRHLYLEISGIPTRRLLQHFPEFERLADKIIWGSDWPGYWDIAGSLAGIRALPLPDPVKEAVLGGNAARLLGLDPA